MTLACVILACAAFVLGVVVGTLLAGSKQPYRWWEAAASCLTLAVAASLFILCIMWAARYFA